jgi:Tfp pilus assembly protein PilF
MVIVKFIFLLGLLMAKYTAQDIKTLAWAMQIAKDEGRPFAVLTGAGCSKTAEVRLADEIVDFVESSKYGSMIRERENLSTLKGLEYGYVMGKLLPTERKAILTEVLRDAKVNWGHIALAALMKAEYVGRVLTFNFDSVLARASGINGMYPATYDFGVSPANNLQHVVTPSILHLHGQGHGPVLVNTTDQTEAQGKILYPIFENTLNQSDLLVIGYGAKSDKAFPFLHKAFSDLGHANQRHIYWCEHAEGSAPSHVMYLTECSTNGAVTFLEGTDFDNFMIDLATALREFPPLLFSDTAQHVLDDIQPIVVPPKDLRGAEGLLENLKIDLEEWQNILKEKVSIKIRNAMLKRDWAAAVTLESEAVSQADKDAIAWAYTMQGNELADLAKLKSDEGLFELSFEKYEAALKIKPDKHEALNNWGTALSDLAKLKKDEGLFELSFGKYEAALKIKPDKHEALNNWGTALSDLARLKNDEGLFELSSEKYEAALKIKPDDHEALNNWGTALSDLAKFKNDEGLFELSFEKYEAALKIKPDDHEALYNWGTALLDLATLKNDEGLFELSFEKYEAALKITPDKHEALNNWGTALSDLAKLKNDEGLFELSFEKYEAALKIKPHKHEALNNWGSALLDLAKLKNDEGLFELSFEKYEAALKIKPDKREALNNWISALRNLFYLNNDKSLLPRMENLAAQIEKISDQPSYKLACAYALQDKEVECRSQLLKCKAAGTLPDAAHLAIDEDMKNYWERDWFKALLV